MRALWLHYPEDRHARGLGNEYLWGRDLLVAPVFEKGATHREVYLPAGTWYDWWTAEKHEGSRAIDRSVDLATMPIYVRAGAIVPVDPVRQFTGEKVDAPLTMRIYRGANGDYTLYEDDGESLAYLKGETVLTRFEWDDTARRLRIRRDTQKSKSTVSAVQSLRIEVIPDGTVKTLNYTGKPITIDFGN